jgi:hypothetical protein
MIVLKCPTLGFVAARKSDTNTSDNVFVSAKYADPLLSQVGSVSR